MSKMSYNINILLSHIDEISFVSYCSYSCFTSPLLTEKNFKKVHYVNTNKHKHIKDSSDTNYNLVLIRSLTIN